MKLSTTTILAGISTAQAQTQTFATWFSTSTANLLGISTWRSVAYGPTLVTPIPTTWMGVSSTLTSIFSEPTASRNINITSWSTVQVTPSGIKTVIVTTTVTSFGISTISMEGTGTSTAYVTSTPAMITFTSTLCANSDGSLPKKTVTRYTETYTPFPGQFPTTTPSSFPTAVTSYVQEISSLRVFVYIGTTSYYTSTTTVTNWASATTTTTTSTSLINGLIPAIYTYTSYTTTTTTIWSLASLVVQPPNGTSCPPTSPNTTPVTVTVTHAAQCASTSLISSRDDRAVAVIRDLDTHKWTSQGPNFNSELTREAFRDPSVCCQLCVDNANRRGGCVASEWTGGWLEGCKLWYYVGERIWGDSGGEGEGEVCRGVVEELEYFADGDRFGGQGSFLQARACGGLRYVGRG